jgi:hypothetical protein
LSLPLWSHMSDEIVGRICSACARIHEARDDVRSRLAAMGPKG